MATGEADVGILELGNSYRHNAITYDTVPFISMDWYNHWRDSLNFVCPLPKRKASFYNILTPLSPLSWYGIHNITNNFCSIYCHQ